MGDILTALSTWFADLWINIFAYLIQLGKLPLPLLVLRLLIDFGWLVIVWIFLWGLLRLYLRSRQMKFLSQQRYILLAIDIPHDTEQTPKAAENLITNLSGAHSQITFREKWMEGVVQLHFALEIVSIEGHVQFLVYTPVQFRELVEAAVQSQYPEAEITEVEDYTKEFPEKFPDDKYNWKGGDLGPVKSHVYPFRTYLDFEHTLDSEFKDPLALVLENMSRLGKGEQAWFQVIVRPEGFDWLDECKAEVKKILGESNAAKQSLAQKILLAPFNAIGAVFEGALGMKLFGGSSPDKPPKKMLDLKPEELTQIKAIQDKKHKIGFMCNIRLFYLAERTHFKGPRVSALIGGLKQLNSNVINSLRPYWSQYGTGNDYWFEWRRKSKVAYKQGYMMRAYKSRNIGDTYPPFILNAEELATIFHFPSLKTVGLAMLKRTESKKGEAPVNLPISSDEDKGSTEGTLPMIKNLDQADELTFDIDNDYFEERFAIDKDKFKKDRDARLKRLEEARAQAKKEDEEKVQALEDELESIVNGELSPEELVETSVDLPKKPAREKKGAEKFFDNSQSNNDEEVPEDFFDKGNPPPNLPIG
ncbi:MAG TPA: hypothetical protein PL066_01350 [bacterium]|nr:hypothetical protein [bacterium]